MTAYAPIAIAPLRPRVALSPNSIALLCVALATVTLRFGQFGNPIAGLDEQFYLLVGDRMWHGELPYVDIWDRKPLGLFLLFAAIRTLPGNGVLAAQLVATLAVAATAWCATVLARRSVGWVPATMAGIFYVAGLNELWGETTQTPVFYNLLTAGAALLTLRAVDDPARRSRSTAAAMLLAGLAIQIKTSAVFQGSFFGLWILGAVWRDTRDRNLLAATALRCTAIGAAPTLAAIAAYLLLGHFPEWWQANVASILAKGMPTDAAARGSFAESLILFFPAGLLTCLGFWAQTRRLERYDATTAFHAGWIAVSVADFLALGGYYPHYALPLLLACTVFVAHAFALKRVGPTLFVLVLIWPFAHATWMNPKTAARERGYAEQVVAHMPAAVHDRCLFIYEGPVAYYRLTDACRVTRFPFSAHLSSRREAPSLGVDPARELDAVMARHPAVVMTVEHSSWRDRNLAIERQIGRYLLRDYRLLARLPHRTYAPEERVLFWQRR